MQQHYTVEGTPLKYHKFLQYVGMPLNILNNAGNLVTAALEMDAFNWGYALDFGFSFLFIVLAALCVSGFSRWKSYAWYSVVGMQVAAMVYNLLLVVISAIYSPSTLAYDVVTLIGNTAVGILICIYYYKRKPLFFQSEPSAAEPVAAYAPPAPPAAAAPVYPTLFCPNCGVRLLSDSIFCSECGTRIN